MKQEALELPSLQTGEYSKVAFSKKFHEGVIGIVASRIKDQFYRPTIVFAPSDHKGLIKGSGRSIGEVHLRDALDYVYKNNSNVLSKFGGHAMAAGLTIKRCHFDGFVAAFNDIMAQMDDDVFAEQKFTDGVLQADDFSLRFAEYLAQANIWGHGFAPPIFDGVFEVLSFKVLKDKHLKLSLRYPNVQYPIDAIYFNFDPEVWDYRAEEVHLLFQLDINEWNGKQSLQLMIKDLALVT